MKREWKYIKRELKNRVLRFNARAKRRSLNMYIHNGLLEFRGLSTIVCVGISRQEIPKEHVSDVIEIY